MTTKKFLATFGKTLIGGSILSVLVGVAYAAKSLPWDTLIGAAWVLFVVFVACVWSYVIGERVVEAWNAKFHD